WSVDGNRSASETYAFPSSAGGSSSSFSIPCRPEAIVAADARYGFTSPPEMRDPTRIAEPEPTMRNPHVRLSRPQASVVGAHDPAANRLYEFTFGAKKIASSRAHAI